MRHLLVGLVCASLCCVLTGCGSGESTPTEKDKGSTSNATSTPATSNPATSNPATSAASTESAQTTETAVEESNSAANLVLVSLNVPNMT